MSKNEFKYKFESYQGQFVDYRGTTRDFTMVAVSIPVSDTDSLSVSEDVTETIECEVPAKNILNEETGEITTVPAKTVKKDIDYVERVAPVAKILSVGVSVRCDRDKDQNLGVKIAYGRALKYKGPEYEHCLFATHAGMINTMMVKAFLEQEAEHFKKNPGSYLDSYNKDKEAYQKTGKIAPVEMTNAEYAKYKATESLGDKLRREANL